jgi:hypothetical protein
MLRRIFLFWLLSFFPLILSAQSQNVLKDPGFEHNNKAWTILNTGDFQTEVIRSGTYALKVSQGTPGFSGATQIITFQPGIHKVEVSGWMKTENVIQGFSPFWKAGIAVEIQNEYGQSAGHDVAPVGQQKGTSEWTYYKNSYIIPEGGRQIKIFVLLSNCAGTAWFDDLQVYFFNSAGDTLPSGPESIAGNKPLIYTKKQLQSDYADMVTYLKTHPAIYKFTSRKEFAKLTTLQYKKIKDSLSPTEFYSICSPVVAKVGCNHTFLNNRQISLLPASSFFPFKVHFINERMFVIRSGEHVPELTPGSEIIEINGISVSEIYSTIYNNLPADGYIHAGRQFFLNNSFGYFYALFFGIKEKYILRYKAYKDKEVKTCSFSAGEYKIAEAQLLDSNRCRDASLCFAISEETNTAIISVKSFVYYDRPEYFRAFVDDCFHNIRKKNINNLIFDHRGLGGGDPYCSAYLLSYLIHKPVKYFEKAAPAYENLKAPLTPAKNAFTGKLLVLTDNGGGSTSGHLNALIKHHKLGLFIGQETCATYTCNAASKNFILNNTKLDLSVAQITNTVAVNSLPVNRGIIPDIEISPALEDLISGRDVVMEFALELIKQGK